jgi:hypothetical protein
MNDPAAWTQSQGHPIHASPEGYRYDDTNELMVGNPRPCVQCQEMPTPFDACLGYIPGVVSACCGHGVKDGYIRWGANLKTHRLDAIIE